MSKPILIVFEFVVKVWPNQKVFLKAYEPNKKVDIMKFQQ
jgi:hypothetical protein